jgi:hypothetical protein
VVTESLQQEKARGKSLDERIFAEQFLV